MVGCPGRRGGAGGLPKAPLQGGGRARRAGGMEGSAGGRGAAACRGSTIVRVQNASIRRGEGWRLRYSLLCGGAENPRGREQRDRGLPARGRLSAASGRRHAGFRGVWTNGSCGARTRGPRCVAARAAFFAWTAVVCRDAVASSVVCFRPGCLLVWSCLAFAPFVRVQAARGTWWWVRSERRPNPAARDADDRTRATRTRRQPRRLGRGGWNEPGTTARRKRPPGPGTNPTEEQRRTESRGRTGQPVARRTARDGIVRGRAKRGRTRHAWGRPKAWRMRAGPKATARTRGSRRDERHVGSTSWEPPRRLRGPARRGHCCGSTATRGRRNGTRRPGDRPSPPGEQRRAATCPSAVTAACHQERPESPIHRRPASPRRPSDRRSERPSNRSFPRPSRRRAAASRSWIFVAAAPVMASIEVF